MTNNRRVVNFTTGKHICNSVTMRTLRTGITVGFFRAVTFSEVVQSFASSALRQLWYQTLMTTIIRSKERNRCAVEARAQDIKPFIKFIKPFCRAMYRRTEGCLLGWLKDICRNWSDFRSRYSWICPYLKKDDPWLAQQSPSHAKIYSEQKWSNSHSARVWRARRDGMEGKEEDRKGPGYPIGQ